MKFLFEVWCAVKAVCLMVFRPKKAFEKACKHLIMEYQVIDGVIDVATNEKLIEEKGLPKMPKEMIDALQVHRMNIKREMNKLGIKEVKKEI